MLEDQEFDFDDDDADYNSEDEDADDTACTLLRSETLVGTANYLSPEVVGMQPQTCAVDVWALGCILFKMLTGSVPFKGTVPMKIEKDILARNIHWPKEDINAIMSTDAQDLVNKLIQLDPAERLGSNLESMKQLKAHPWFADIDFKKVSKPDFIGARELVVQLVYKMQSEK